MVSGAGVVGVHNRGVPPPWVGSSGGGTTAHGPSAGKRAMGARKRTFGTRPPGNASSGPQPMGWRVWPSSNARSPVPGTKTISKVAQGRFPHAQADVGRHTLVVRCVHNHRQCSTH